MDAAVEVSYLGGERQQRQKKQNNPDTGEERRFSASDRGNIHAPGSGPCLPFS